MSPMTEAPFTVVQLSDIHWGAPPAPIDGRDATVSFGHVIEHANRTQGTPDLYVATGDLTDDGSPAAAAALAEALGGLGAPVHCLAGNHDSGITLDVLVAAHPAVTAPATSRHGNWLFCYVDTNAQGVVRDADGTRHDHPDRMHAARTVAVFDDDLAALDDAIAATDAEHVMVWLHHPPLLPPRFDRPGGRSAEFATLHALLAEHGKVRAVAAGHMHTGFSNAHEGIAYHGTPTTWMGMDFERLEMTAPGYRTFAFHPDGRVETESVLVEHPDYPAGVPLPDWVPKIFAEHFGVPLTGLDPPR